MRKIKLNHKSDLIPDRWDELKLKHLIGFEQVDTTDRVAMFSVLVGMPLEVAENSKGIEEQIYHVTDFLFESSPDWQNLKHPTHLVIDGKPYKIPRLDKCVVGQNIMLDQILSKTLIEIVPKILAIYFQPLIDGKFERKRLPEIETLILECNGLEAFATANFFLGNGRNLYRIMKAGYIRVKPTPLPTLPMTEVSKSTGVSSGLTVS